MKIKKTNLQNFVIDDVLKEKIKDYANEFHISQSAVCKMALVKFLEKQYDT